MKEIPIHKYYTIFALVDDEYYELVIQFKWYLSQRYNTMYVQRSLYKETGQRRYEFMHNLIMGTKGVDHIDGNGLNNQRSNLRIATQSQNNANSQTAPKGQSKYKGVVMNTPASNWKAQIRIEGKKTYLGSFETEIEAAKAYDKAAKKVFGEFAYLNFPDE